MANTDWSQVIVNVHGILAKKQLELGGRINSINRHIGETVVKNRDADVERSRLEAQLLEAEKNGIDACIRVIAEARNGLHAEPTA